MVAALPCLAREIPSGTELQIRLTAPVSSESATVGQQISAIPRSTANAPGVDRDNVPTSDFNDTGDEIHTVLEFQNQ